MNWPRRISCAERGRTEPGRRGHSLSDMWVQTSSLKRLALTAIVLCLAACAKAEDHGVEPNVGRSESAVRLVAGEQADLHLWVSNQSFAEPTVVVTVTIDGIEIVSQRFDVKSQHNWILFPVKAPPGPHTLEARSDTGVSMRQQLTLPEQERRYAVVNYWTDPERAFSWHIQSTPVGFD